MGALAAALVLAAAHPDAGSIGPPLFRQYTAAWQRALVEGELLEWQPEEPGGPAVDPATRVVVVGAKSGALRAYRADGRELWQFRAGAGFQAAPLVRGGVVYAGSLDGRLYALELASGALRWAHADGEEIGTTPLPAGDLLVYATLQDTLVAVDLASGVWKWHRRRDQREGFTIRGVARPVLVRDTVYAGWSDGTVSALEAASGKVVWERKVAASGDQLDVDGLASDGERLYAACYGGQVLALEPGSGKTLWQQKGAGASRVLAADGRVYAVTAADVLALDAASGAVRWRRPLQGAPAGAPLRMGSRLLVPNARGLLLLDPGTGHLLRSFDPGTGVSAPPAALGRRAYVLSNGGALLALDFEP